MKSYHGEMDGYDMRVMSGHHEGEVSPRALHTAVMCILILLCFVLVRVMVHLAISLSKGTRSQSLECNASDKPISLSRPVAMLGNLPCKGG